MAKKYLNVAYKDRDLAKRLGARWDPAVERWYCPAGSPLSKIFRWRAEAAVKPSENAPANLAAQNHRPLPPLNENFELPLAG